MMSGVIALIPAKRHSSGIPDKNWKDLAGESCVHRAAQCIYEASLTAPYIPMQIVVSTDTPSMVGRFISRKAGVAMLRPPELAQDDTPMIDVVKHALAHIPGPEEQIVLIVQPTQPLRRPEHLQQAIALLQESGADSVVSVVEVPSQFNPFFQCRISGTRPPRLHPWMHGFVDGEQQVSRYRWDAIKTRRQDVGQPSYIRDGTVYAFWRRTVTKHGSFYGRNACPLIIPAEESCALDTMADWAEAERRLRMINNRNYDRCHMEFKS